MLELRNKADLQRLVDEGLEESLTLDYKASPALTRDGKGPDELCKDVTALANSLGGQLVYGIEEDKATKKPSRVDSGVDDPKITREWIEQVLNSRVQPRLNGVLTTRIDMENGKFGYVVTVPQSQIGPHQAPDQKYYRRFDLQSVPMHDYEIKDIMRRSTTPDLFVRLTFESGERYVLEMGNSDELQASRPFALKAYIQNRSAQPAFHAVVDIGVGAELTPKSSGSFKRTTLSNNDRDVPMNWFQWSLVSPPSLPVFRELALSMTDDPIKLSVARSELGNQSLFDLTIKISAPGFSSTEHWAILSRGKTMTLHPPGSPYAADRR
jgi:Putative DNA-binding domain